MILKTLAATLAAIAVTLTAAPAAHADEEAWPLMRLDSTVACVVPDFPVTGSGWKIQQSVRLWNQAQPLVQLVVGQHAECNGTINVHRYVDSPDAAVPFMQNPSYCGFTSFENAWTSVVTSTTGVFLYTTVDVWLNDNCSPNAWTDGGNHNWQSKTIVGHELGHALGLPHTTGSESIMSSGYDAWRLRGHIEQEVVVALRILRGL